MTTLYKLTRPDLTTYGGYPWVLNEQRRFPGTGSLCGPGWCHAYLTPELAVFLNPIHANYQHPFRLFRAEGEIGIRDGDLKVGCRLLVLREECVVPRFTIEQHIAFGIFCTLAGRRGRQVPVALWDQWAEDWLSGKNRTGEPSRAAAADPARAARSAAWAVEAAVVATPSMVIDLAEIARQAAAWRDTVAQPNASNPR